MVPVPDESARADITARLDSLASAMEQHPQWTPPNPHPALLQLWDFVKRSHYIMTELENIRTGRPLKHPDQIPPHEDATDNEERAQMSFTDVLTRTLTINKIVTTPSMMAIMGQPNIEFGDDVKTKSQELQDAILSIPE
ncbi:unnamed protein product [Clonostachys byssicola]|uniref:Uncharacterized protein n=1 Tax=Clonostachys byssicola TaxID=160290 RepID=A0A9N9UNA5_9HYPO|nr:unnamed protein product [Clonostachys byssicola]